MPTPTRGRSSAGDIERQLRQRIQDHRDLAAADPDQHLPIIADLSSRLGLALAGHGRLDEAYTHLRKTVQFCRAAPATDAGVASALAVGLTDLGLVQSWLGRYTDALTSTVEAVQVLRQVADSAHTLAHVEPPLANALDSLGSRYAALGQYREAIGPATEAVERYRALTRCEPGYESALASSLNNLGVRLCDLGRNQEALRATTEALSVFRRCHAADPETHLAGLAHTLSNLGTRFARLDRHDEVAAPVLEVVDLLHGLEVRHPADRLGQLVGSLEMLATYLRDHGHRREARAAVGAARMLRQHTTPGR